MVFEHEKHLLSPAPHLCCLVTSQVVIPSNPKLARCELHLGTTIYPENLMTEIKEQTCLLVRTPLRDDNTSGPLSGINELRYPLRRKFIRHHRHPARANQEYRRHEQAESSQTQFGSPSQMREE